MTEHYSGHDPADGCGCLLALAAVVLAWVGIIALVVVVVAWRLAQ
jgi:hypothetical protein